MFSMLPAAGEVHVEARVFGEELVVGGVIHCRATRARPHLVAFAGVVVDDVEDDSMPAACSERTIVLNSCTLLRGDFLEGVIGVGELK
jgi:hypothetical protein